MGVGPLFLNYLVPYVVATWASATTMAQRPEEPPGHE